MTNLTACLGALSFASLRPVRTAFGGVSGSRGRRRGMQRRVFGSALRGGPPVEGCVVPLFCLGAIFHPCAIHALSLSRSLSQSLLVSDDGGERQVGCAAHCPWPLRRKLVAVGAGLPRPFAVGDDVAGVRHATWVGGCLCRRLCGSGRRAASSSPKCCLAAQHGARAASAACSCLRQDCGFFAACCQPGWR